METRPRYDLSNDLACGQPIRGLVSNRLVHDLAHYLLSIFKGADLASPTCHGTGCFFTPPRKSVHILGAPKKNPWIPAVALVDFTPNRRQWVYSYHDFDRKILFYFEKVWTNEPVIDPMSRSKNRSNSIEMHIASPEGRTKNLFLVSN